MAETEHQHSKGLEGHDSPDGGFFVKLRREEMIKCNPALVRLVEYAESALDHGIRIDIVSESGVGAGHLAAAVREKFESVDLNDVIAISPRTLMLDSDSKIDRVWGYIDEALVEDGSVAVIDYRDTFEVSKPHAEVLFSNRDFRHFLTPWGQIGYRSERELDKLGELIWDKDLGVGQ